MEEIKKVQHKRPAYLPAPCVVSIILIGDRKQMNRFHLSSCSDKGRFFDLNCCLDHDFVKALYLNGLQLTQRRLQNVNVPIFCYTLNNKSP